MDTLNEAIAMTQSTPSLNIKPGYKPQADDTSVEGDAFGFWLLRQRTNLQRLMMGAQMVKSARQLSLCGLKNRFPHLSKEEFASKVALAWLQEDCPKHFTPTGTEMTWIQDSTGLAIRLHHILELLHIPYYITGGVAAITYGEPRTTRDLDIVLEISRSDIDRLVDALTSEGFYVPGVEDVKSGQMKTLGITDVESVSRADLVLSETNEFDRLKFQRRRALQLAEDTILYFASPEDLILSKLNWGKHSQSEKQWRDILGILKVQGTSLEHSYLTEWADRLDLLEDLNRAIREAGI